MGAGLVAKDASLEEIRFTFDLCGFVLLPAVLDESECCAILAEVKEALRYREDAVASGARPGTPFAPGIAVRNHPNTNELRHPRHYHSWLSHAGLSGGLLDHPLLVPILNELLGESEPREGSYNFRCDDSMTLWREPGFTADELTPSPHGGGGQRARALGYHAQGQKIYAGSVRVVWELTGVPTDTCGGTLLLPGSHKASFPFPPVVKKAGNAHMVSYSCPPGSVLLFTEALLHASADWTHEVQPRVAIFNLHRLALPHMAILTMPPMRRTLFRGVWSGDFAGLDGDRAVQGDRSNSEYSHTNSAAYGAATLDSSSARL